MSFRPLVPSLAAFGAALLTAACGAERTVAPDEPAPTIVASPGLLAAVGDAESRLLPAIAPTERPAVAAALRELHLALDAGQAARGRRAVDALRRAIDAAQGSDAAADLGAIETLAAVAEGEVRGAPAGQPFTTPRS